MVISAIVNDKKWQMSPSSEQAIMSDLCIIPLSHGNEAFEDDSVDCDELLALLTSKSYSSAFFEHTSPVTSCYIKPANVICQLLCKYLLLHRLVCRILSYKLTGDTDSCQGLN